MTQLSTEAQASLAALAADYLAREPRTIMTQKPLHPPVRILTGQCEGIEPLHMPEYVRRFQKGTSGSL